MVGLLSRPELVPDGVTGSGSRRGIIALFPFFRILLQGWRRDFLNQVEGHFRIDVAGRVDRVMSPTGPEDLLNLLPAASVPANQFDSVDNRGRLELLPKLELELGEIRDEI